jgi:CBS domain-containing protein
LAKVEDVMSRGVDLVLSSSTVQHAANQMAERDVGAVLVGSADGLEGILTDRDIILRVVVEGKHPAKTSVREVMSPNLFSCRPDDTVEAALAEMRERQIRRLPVLRESGEFLGVVTLSDLAKAVDSPERIETALREISEPHRRRKPSEEEPPAAAAEKPGPPQAA